MKVRHLPLAISNPNELPLTVPLDSTSLPHMYDEIYICMYMHVVTQLISRIIMLV